MVLIMRRSSGAMTFGARRDWNFSGSSPANGILIRMFFNDHPPPHFHARYGEFEATIDISTLDVLEGQLPRRALNLVQEWAMIHRGELLEDGQSGRAHFGTP